MPKTLPIARSPMSSPGRARLAPLALFVVAYLAVLGVLFAPEGYFLSAMETDTSPVQD